MMRRKVGARPAPERRGGLLHVPVQLQQHGLHGAHHEGQRHEEQRHAPTPGRLYAS